MSWTFRLRTLLIAMFVFCLGFGWVSFHINESAAEQQLLEDLRLSTTPESSINSYEYNGGYQIQLLDANEFS